MRVVLHAAALVLNLMSASAAATAAANTWHVDPISVKIAHDRTTLFPSSATTIDIAAMKLWGAPSKELKDVRVTFHELKDGTGVFAAKHWSYKQQGYVKVTNLKSGNRYKCLENILLPGPPPPPPPLDTNCSNTPWNECWTGCPNVEKNWTDCTSCNGGKICPTPHCTGHAGCKGSASCNQCACNSKNTTCGSPRGVPGFPCMSGWYPDPLLDVPEKGIPLIPKVFTQPIYLEVCVPYAQKAGKYTGKVLLSAAGGETLATVPVALEVWDISIPRTSDSNAFSTAFNFNSNMSAWYPKGTKPEVWWKDWMPFLAHHRAPADSIYLHGPRPTAEYEELAASGAKWMGMGDAGISFRPPQNGTVPAGYVQGWIDKLTPAMAALKQKGLLNKSYVYGFDEMPELYNASVYEIFGGLKKKFPELTTMAVLDWPTFPEDLPLDIWVDEYADYGTSESYKIPTAKETLRQKWLAGMTAAGKQHKFWWYWCIGPTDPRALNTFIERPAIQARLLYWLTALHAVDGMLYYDVAIWSSQCPKLRKCKSVGRINSTALTDFVPETFPNPSPGSTNGDGSFTYPGEGGKPLGSIRLSNIADGIEDWELLNMLGSSAASISHADDLIAQVVTNETSRHENPRLLEKLRRQAAKRVLAQRAREKAKR